MYSEMRVDINQPSKSNIIYYFLNLLNMQRNTPIQDIPIIATGKSSRIPSPSTPQRQPSSQSSSQSLQGDSKSDEYTPTGKPSVLDQYRQYRSKRGDSSRTAVHRSRGIKLYSSQYLKVVDQLHHQEQNRQNSDDNRTNPPNGEEKSNSDSQQNTINLLDSRSYSWMNQPNGYDNPHLNPYFPNGRNSAHSLIGYSRDGNIIHRDDMMMLKFEDMKTLRRYRTWSGNNTFCCGGAVMLGSHPYQLLLSIFLITITYLAWILLVLPFFHDIWLYAGAVTLFTINVITLISTAATDPGIYPRRKPLLVPNPSSARCTQEVDDISAPLSNAAHDSNFFKMVLFAIGFDFFQCCSGKNKRRKNGNSLYGAVSSSNSYGSPISSPGKPSQAMSNVIEHEDSSSQSVESFFALNQYIPTNMIKDEYCSICHIIHSKRTRHCKFCNNCVETFDHHCPVSYLYNILKLLDFIFSFL